MSRQWEWMFSKVGEVSLSVTASADSLPDAVREANACLQTFFEDMERFQAENPVRIQVDPFSHGHLASVTCSGCGADVTRLDGQPPMAVADLMVAECVCKPDEADDETTWTEPMAVHEARFNAATEIDDMEVRMLYAETGDERLRTLL